MYKQLQYLLFLFLFTVHTVNGQLSINALQFDGVNDLATIPANAAYQPGTGDFTIELWFRSATPAGGATPNCVLLSTRNPNVDGIELFLYGGRPGVFINGNGVIVSSTGNPDYRDSVCHHLAVRRTAGVITIFVDGLLKLTYSIPGSVTAGGNMVIGGRNASGTYGYLKGIIKEVRYWNRSLLLSEIINGLSKVYSAATPNLIGYWRLNSTSGQVVIDFSATANNGVLGTTASIETIDPVFGTGCPSCAQPVVTVTPVVATICPGDSVLLTATSGAGFTYKWYKDAVLIPAATAVSYYAKTAAVYSVVVTNGSGCSVYSSVANVTIPIDKFRNLTANVPVRNGIACLNSGSINLYEVSEPGATYQWYKNNVAIPSAIFSGYGVSSIQPGLYSCQVNYQGCTLRSNTVDAKILTITATTDKSLFCQDTAYLSYVSNFTPLVQGVWKNGAATVATTPYLFTSVSGNYNYVIADTATCPSPISSNYLFITAGQPPVLTMHPTPIISQLSGGFPTIDTCVSFGNFILPLYVNGQNEDVDTAFQWYENGIPQPFTTAYYQAYNNSLLSCYLNTACGMTYVSPVIIRVIDYNNPPMTTVTSSNQCSGSLEVLPYWDHYQWLKNGSPIPGANSSFYNTNQSGSYSCELTNRCGTITSQPHSFNFSGPGAVITASQPYNLCGGSKLLVAFPNNYTYKWLLNNVQIAGATSQTYSATVAGNYRVIVTNACTSDTSSVLTISAGTAVPVTPGAMTGPTRVCPGTNGIVFSIPAVANATTYQWIIPPGLTATTATSGSGALSMTVNVSGSYVSGDVQVRAGNACGYGPYRLKTVRTIIPASPGAVTGPTYGVCNSTQSYSIAAVAQATTYLWVAPPGANIVSGQGTTTVTVSYNSSFGIDTLRVSAGNSCAYGPLRKVVVRGKPQNPGAITGPSTACNGQTGVVYNITPIFGANSYTWNKPTGSTITNGQNTLSATITFGPNSGNVTVKAVNGCGISGVATKSITINCREGEMAAREFEVYPNPSPGDFTLVGDPESREYNYFVFDMTGKAMESGELKGSVRFGATLPAGSYILQVRGEGFEKHFRIIKI